VTVLMTGEKPSLQKGCVVSTQEERENDGSFWPTVQHQTNLRHILRICQVNNINCAFIGLFYYHVVA
jgi:hypothetical protein